MRIHASRRNFCKGVCCAGMAAAGGLLGPRVVGHATAEEAKHAATHLTADEALALLKEGNRNFTQDSPLQAIVGRQRRLEIAKGQTPFAVLVGCSDSRVPPEILFGRGLGELFIVRNAGNTVDTAALGSIEYAVGALGVPLILVMGHERCGAVAAALSVVTENASFPGSIGHMVEAIIPAALKARAGLAEGADKDALLDAAVRENVSRVVTELRTSGPVLLKPFEEGKLKIVGARYDLDEGNVDFFMES